MPRPARPRLAFAAIAAAFAAVSSLQSLLIPVLSVLGDDIHADQVGQTWIITSWLITAAVATPLLGRAGDLVGRRRVFLAAIVAVAVGTVLAALAPNLVVMLLARVLQGLGGAIFPLGFGIARDAFEARRVPSVIGALSAILAVGSGIGTVISGPIAEAFGWRALFVLPLGLALIAGALAFRIADVGERATGGINISAAVLLSGWLVALLLPLSAGNQWGWGSPWVVGLLVLAVLLIVAWIAVELRSRVPLVDMRMMRIPGVWTTNLTALLTGAAMFGVWAFLPRLAETPTSSGFGIGASVSLTGLIMLPMLVTMATIGFVVGPLSRRIPFPALLASGAAISALSILSMAVFHDSAWQLAIATGGLGIGTGLTVSATPNLIVQSVPATQTGIATGINANVRTIGGALGTTIFTAVVGSTVVAGLPGESGYIAAFVVGAVLAGIGAIVPLRLLNVRPRRPRARAIPIIETGLPESEAA
ncbi:MFS transporter [Homoserinibacter sp. GY 40078]|uniref:MFS transporter n=1 Tax=Homoserinibacter sp. GY 40078 TaxID=2603275 RepID=UPI00164F9E27|nr:MFS transporter [Homoserinibacter sp. GY 40078]